MRNLALPLICIMLLFACKKETSNSTKTKNIGNEVIIEKGKKENDLTYEKKVNCDDCIKSIDFSSFCFATKKIPKYRLVRDAERNCQYQIYDNKGYQKIDFSIAFADFQKPFGEEPQPELAKSIFVKAFSRTKSRRLGGSTAKDISGLGDEAYIGYNRSQNNKEQYLGVRIGNVSFTFIFKHGKEMSQQSCMEAEKDLIKIGRLVIESLTK